MTAAAVGFGCADFAVFYHLPRCSETVATVEVLRRNREIFTINA
jgi:chlorite dismutase